jgi:hypothetical protein
MRRVPTLRQMADQAERFSTVSPVDLPVAADKVAAGSVAVAPQRLEAPLSTFDATARRDASSSVLNASFPDVNGGNFPNLPFDGNMDGYRVGDMWQRLPRESSNPLL